jgi:uridylate kinase
MTNEVPSFRRILLKLSGEALAGKEAYGIDPSVLQALAKEISSIHELGVQVGIVIGGGNIFRGLRAQDFGMSRVPADHMGMLATVINTLALAEALKHQGAEARVMTAIDMIKIAEPYTQDQAITHLSNGRIVLFGAGTGNPYFTTDTAAALKALEIDADVLLKATKVDGVYDADPEKDPAAEFFSRLSYEDVLNRQLKVMDLTAVSLSMSRQLPVIVFNVRKEANLVKIVTGQKIGTMIAGEAS